jgi:hypothetical protein
MAVVILSAFRIRRHHRRYPATPVSVSPVAPMAETAAMVRGSAVCRKLLVETWAVARAAESAARVEVSGEEGGSAGEACGYASARGWVWGWGWGWGIEGCVDLDSVSADTLARGNGGIVVQVQVKLGREGQLSDVDKFVETNFCNVINDINE